MTEKAEGIFREGSSSSKHLKKKNVYEHIQICVQNDPNHKTCFCTHVDLFKAVFMVSYIL